MHVKLFNFLLFFAFLEGVFLDSCQQHTTCHDCIQDSSVCQWCTLNSYNGDRCVSKDYNLTMCQGHLENPENKREPLKNASFSSLAGKICQITPQKYKLKIRPGEPMDFPFSFAAVEDYPVDVYFLLDASRTMYIIRSDVAAQAKNIYDILHKATKDVYLGMGTFIDKNALPYAQEVSKKKAYSFKNQLKLNSNYRKFREVMNKTDFGLNRDLPEGGLDALAQVMACNKGEIGWRNESRKIIIFLTNGPYHAAGDGRSAGIFQPYDGKCYIVNDTYTNELEMDYPSVSMINKLAKENEMIIIFAVSNRDAEYKNLAAAVSGAQKEKIGRKDSIVKILQDIYERITKKIKLKVKNIRSGTKSVHRNNFKLTFDPDCTKEGNPACNANTKQIYNFTGTITLTEYINIDNFYIDIAIEGIKETLELEIEIIKNCSCENEVKKITSPYCGNEELKCGICMCPPSKYGSKCECRRNEDNKFNNNTKCFMTDNSTECSGNGDCECGVCQCHEGYVGRYCQCNEQWCPRDQKGAVCGGIDRGKCNCGKTCDCAPAWQGDDCDCPKTTTHCKGVNGKVCNDRGDCGCEGCICKEPEKWDNRKYSDRWCDINPSPERHEDQCKLLTECVASFLRNHEQCPCSFTHCEVVDNLDDDTADLNTEKWHNCSNIRIDVGCYGDFMYKYNNIEYGIFLKMQRHVNCAESYITYGGIFLATLILVGTCTLVAWKLLTDARDRREYQRFMKNKNVSMTCRNPIFSPASKIYNNPRFGKRSFH